jgi:hypothetical protein
MKYQVASAIKFVESQALFKEAQLKYAIHKG